MKDGRKFTLLPLRPIQVLEDQLWLEKSYAEYEASRKLEQQREDCENSPHENSERGLRADEKNSPREKSEHARGKHSHEKKEHAKESV